LLECILDVEDDYLSLIIYIIENFKEVLQNNFVMVFHIAFLKKDKALLDLLGIHYPALCSHKIKNFSNEKSLT
jgi:hypothetical protein